jgi:hypothetical protein
MTEQAAQKYLWRKIGVGRKLHAFRTRESMWSLCHVSGPLADREFVEAKACKKCLAAIEEQSTPESASTSPAAL